MNQALLANPSTALAAKLIQCPSVAPDDAGAQQILVDRLEAAGFSVERIHVEGVHSFWASYGQQGPVIAVSGHSDVVPPGDADRWESPPFEPQVRGGRLYGRGAADMKGPLAACVEAMVAFATENPGPPFRLGALIAGDEEPVNNHGTLDLLAWLKSHGISLDYCIVTEPTSRETLGDTIKIGRRGSIYGFLKVQGVQGHSAFPSFARNPISDALPVLQALDNLEWDQGNDAFPATTFQLTNLNAGTGAANVIPGSLTAQFNIRFSTAITEEQIKQRIQDIVDRSSVPCELEWSCDARPFLTQRGLLTELAVKSIEDELGVTPELSTGGGTSDARFIAPTGAQVVEFGPVGGSAHQFNESVGVDELERLSKTYLRIFQNFRDAVAAGQI